MLSALVQLVAGPSNLATTVRLMAGNEIVTEGFKEAGRLVRDASQDEHPLLRAGQRPRPVVLRGYLSMIGELAGDQWNEGDVLLGRPPGRAAGRVLRRRRPLPDLPHRARRVRCVPAVIQRELDRYLPFLATTKVLMAAVRNGVGRETAHEAIKEAAVGTALGMRRGQAENDVFARLAADERLGLTAGQLESLVADPITLTGAAVPQVEGVVRRGGGRRRHPEAAAYSPGAIL